MYTDRGQAAVDLHSRAIRCGQHSTGGFGKNLVILSRSRSREHYGGSLTKWMHGLPRCQDWAPGLGEVQAWL